MEMKDHVLTVVKSTIEYMTKNISNVKIVNLKVKKQNYFFDKKLGQMLPKKVLITKTVEKERAEKLLNILEDGLERIEKDKTTTKNNKKYLKQMRIGCSKQGAFFV